MQWELIRDKYNTFVFDCDGVILDSNQIKSHSFGETVKSFGKSKMDVFVDYHKKNGGITRQEKLKFFCQNILMLSEFDDLYNSLLVKYADIVIKKLMTCEFIPGVVDFLEDLHSHHKTLVVVTGGSQTETETIFRARGIEKYFSKILGNPVSKDANMSFLLSKHVFVGNAFYFGDSLLDYQLANKYGLDFMYIYGASEWSNAPEDIIMAKNFNSNVEINS